MGIRSVACRAAGQARPCARRCWWRRGGRPCRSYCAHPPPAVGFSGTATRLSPGRKDNAATTAPARSSPPRALARPREPSGAVYSATPIVPGRRDAKGRVAAGDGRGARGRGPPRRGAAGPAPRPGRPRGPAGGPGGGGPGRARRARMACGPRSSAACSRSTGTTCAPRSPTGYPRRTAPVRRPVPAHRRMPPPGRHRAGRGNTGTAPEPPGRGGQDERVPRRNR